MAARALLLALLCDTQTQGSSVTICFCWTGPLHTNPALCNLWLWSLLSKKEQGHSLLWWAAARLHTCFFPAPYFFFFPSTPLHLECKFRLLTWICKTAGCSGHECPRRINPCISNTEAQGRMSQVPWTCPRSNTSVTTLHRGRLRLEGAFPRGPVSPESLNTEEISIVLVSLVLPGHGWVTTKTGASPLAQKQTYMCLRVGDFN